MWIHKVWKMQSQIGSSFSTWAYKKAFAAV
jgi:hypothetical protein